MTTQNALNTELHDAVVHRDLERCRALIAKGSDVNFSQLIKPGQGRPGPLWKFDQGPLWYATIHGLMEITRLLVDRGADVNTADEEGYTPLILASLHGQAEVCTLLLDQGANVAAQTARGKTALTLARTDEVRAVIQSFLVARDVPVPANAAGRKGGAL